LRAPAIHISSTLTLTPSQWYQHAHHKQMPLRAIARMIQTMLYGRRFFPYYVYNILGGIEEDGESAHPHMLLDNPSTPAR
jgi:20S proteasome alpha/beta subunit